MSPRVREAIRSVHRGVGLTAAVVFGVVAGAIASFALQDTLALGPAPSLDPRAGAPHTHFAPAPPPAAGVGVLVVTSLAPLDPATVERVRARAGVEHVTTVRRGDADLTGHVDAAGFAVEAIVAGSAIPVDVSGVEPAPFARYVAPDVAPRVASLRDQEALVTVTASRRRGARPGSVLAFAGGERVTVVGVVDDASTASAELVVTDATAQRIGLGPATTMVVSSDLPRDEVEAALARELPAPVRIRGPEALAVPTPDGVVSTLSATKELFGEFTYRSGVQGLEQDPAWTAAHIVREPVPLLGEVRCHRAAIEALRGALAQVERENLGYLVDPRSSSACWSMQRRPDGRGLSRHAWGIVVELNGGKNVIGQGSVQDRRLVEILREWGFGWGGEWLVPQPAVFELAAERPRR